MKPKPSPAPLAHSVGHHSYRAHATTLLALLCSALLACETEPANPPIAPDTELSDAELDEAPDALQDTDAESDETEADQVELTDDAPDLSEQDGELTEGHCGDGIRGPGEACDDNNLESGDGCNETCQIEYGWQCPTAGSPCVVVCGDARLGPNEACDDGNQSGGDGCAEDCLSIEEGFACPVEGERCEACGDGIVDPHEACDDANRLDHDGCAANCQRIEDHYACPEPGQACERCGDAQLDPHEQCDDANTSSGDGCDEHCQLEAGAICPSPGDDCVAERCGDGLVAAQESCDDGNRRSGDGCSFSCQREPGWACPNPGQACVIAVCGDGEREGDEACDDGNVEDGDGCSISCTLEAGFYCPQPANPCLPTTCGDGLQEGLEACDDANTLPNDGCSDTCTLETGWACPTPASPCHPTACGDGVWEGTEGCDDGNLEDGDGCDASCQVEALYRCTQSPSHCRRIIEFVSIALFPAPMAANQAIHYDPNSRTFVVYDFSTGDGVEFCTDGTILGTRPRYGIGGTLDGATYDPFNDRFLFVQQNNTLTEVDRSGEVVRVITLQGTNMAAGISVGEDGRLYIADNTSGASNAKHIRVFERFGVTPIDTWEIWVNGPYLDQMVTIPGAALVGIHNVPPGETEYALRLYDRNGTLVGQSTIPGLLFASGHGTQLGLTDGAEAAVDGGSFMLCSAYKTNPTGPGMCESFARRCENHAECASRIPQTICKLDEPIPYCYAPGAARDDFYAVQSGSPEQALDVGRNDLGSDESCTATPPQLLSVSAPDQGGSASLAPDGSAILYAPAPGFCGGTERFDYETLLGTTSGAQSATVSISVDCVCGDGYVDAPEECDDGDSDNGDGCSSACAVELGWTCDDGEPSLCQFIN